MRILITVDSLAGYTLITNLRKLISNAEISIISKENIISYSRSALPYYVISEIDLDDIVFLPKILLDYVVGVTPIEGAYDRQVIATDPEAYIPCIPGKLKQKSMTLWTIKDAERLKSGLKNIGLVGLIGNLLINLHIAYVLESAGYKCKIYVDKNNNKILDSDIKKYLVNMIRKENPCLFAQPGESLNEADLLIWTGFFKNYGVEVNEMFEKKPNCYFIGGAAKPPYVRGADLLPYSEGIHLIEGWLVALRLAELQGPSLKIKGYIISRYKDILIIVIGDRLGSNPCLISTKLRKPKTNSLLETCEEVIVKLIADKNTKKIVGAQLISRGYEKSFLDNLMWLCCSDIRVNELTYMCSLVFPGVFPFRNPVYDAVRALWYKLYL